MHDAKEMRYPNVQPLLPSALRQKKMHSEGGMSPGTLPRSRQDIKKLMIVRQKSLDKGGVHKSEDNEGVNDRAQSEVLQINVV